MAEKWHHAEEKELELVPPFENERASEKTLELFRSLMYTRDLLKSKFSALEKASPVSASPTEKLSPDSATDLVTKHDTLLREMSPQLLLLDEALLGLTIDPLFKSAWHESVGTEFLNLGEAEKNVAQLASRMLVDYDEHHKILQKQQRPKNAEEKQALRAQVAANVLGLNDESNAHDASARERWSKRSNDRIKLAALLSLLYGHPKNESIVPDHPHARLQTACATLIEGAGTGGQAAACLDALRPLVPPVENSADAAFFARYSKIEVDREFSRIDLERLRVDLASAKYLGEKARPYIDAWHTNVSAERETRIVQEAAQQANATQSPTQPVPQETHPPGSQPLSPNEFDPSLIPLVAEAGRTVLSLGSDVAVVDANPETRPGPATYPIDLLPELAQPENAQELREALSLAMGNSFAFYGRPGLERLRHGFDFTQFIRYQFTEAQLNEVRRNMEKGFDRIMVFPPVETQTAPGILDAIVNATATTPARELQNNDQYTTPYISPEAKTSTIRNRPTNRPYMLMSSSGPIPPISKNKTYPELDQLFLDNGWNGFTLLEHLITQRREAESRRNHTFDAYNDNSTQSNWGFLLDSRAPGRAVDAFWSPRLRRVDVTRAGATGRNPGLGARPAGVVIL